MAVAPHNAEDLSFAFEPPASSAFKSTSYSLLELEATCRFVDTSLELSSSNPRPYPILPLIFAVAVVGSFMTQTLARPHVEVDVAVEMPASIFDDKDRLNHRYAHIRAFYLAVLADGLAKQAEHFTDLRFAQLQVSDTRDCRPPSLCNQFFFLHCITLATC